MKNDELRNISNVAVSKDCYKQLKLASIDNEISVQQAARAILERGTEKKINTIDLGNKK